MKVRVFRNLATPWPPYQEGQVVDCDDDLGERIIAAGLGELADKPAKPAAAEKKSPKADK